MARRAHGPSSRLQFSLRTLLLAFVPAALIAAAAAWLFYPRPVDVAVNWDEDVPLHRHDDHAGHFGFTPRLCVTNLSDHTVWYLGYPGDPTIAVEWLVDGKWLGGLSWTTRPHDLPSGNKRWAALRSGESLVVTVAVGEGEPTKFAFGFTTECFPRKVHWVYSPTARVVKRGHDYFLEVEESAQQEVRIAPLNRH